MLAAEQISGRVLARLYPLPFELDESLLGRRKMIEQIRAPASAFPIGERGGQLATHGPSLIHQLQARIFRIKLRYLGLQAAPFG